MTTLERGMRIAEELGLKRDRFPSPSGQYFYDAAPVERLLGESVEVTGSKVPLNGWRFEEFYGEATHAALLIGVGPIVEESEERKLLREIVDGDLGIGLRRSVIERARKLLEGK